MMDRIGKHWTTARSKSTRPAVSSCTASAGSGGDRGSRRRRGLRAPRPPARRSVRYQAPADAADRCRLIATRDRWSATTGHPRRNVRDVYEGHGENAEGPSPTIADRSLSSDHRPYHSTLHAKSSSTHQRRIQNSNSDGHCGLH